METLEKNVDQMYDDMLKITDAVAKTGKIDAEQLEKMQEIKEAVTNMDEASLEPQTSDAEETVEDNGAETEAEEYEDTAEASKEAVPEDAIGEYDLKTGEVAADGTSVEAFKAVRDAQWKNFASGELDQDAIREIAKQFNYPELNDTLTIAKLIQRWSTGERFNPYLEFPKELKDVVDKIIATTPPEKIGYRRMTRKYVSSYVLNELTNAYLAKANTAMDLDTILSQFDEEIKKAADETVGMSQEFGGMLLSIDEQRDAEIEKAIAKAKEEGNEAAVEKLTDMQEYIHEPYNLTNFKEFCKTVRIKAFDVEKPSRTFDSFNAKYIHHKNNINDISICPDILERHWIGYPKDCLKVCLAFCKMCQNYSPDNMKEHTFMYYFIRNIVTIDRLNPKGKLYDSMDEKAKTFYDGFVANLKECVENLKR